jgi:hypothetical protein
LRRPKHSKIEVVVPKEEEEVKKHDDDGDDDKRGYMFIDSLFRIILKFLHYIM